MVVKDLNDVKGMSKEDIKEELCGDDDLRTKFKYSLYSVFDKELKIYNVPFIAENDIVARRTFIRGASDPNSAVMMFPDKFALYEVALYNQITGDVLNIENHKIMDATDLRKD